VEVFVRYSCGTCHADWETGKTSRINRDPSQPDGHWPIKVDVASVKEGIAGAENIIKVIDLAKAETGYTCSCGVFEPGSPYSLNALRKKFGLKLEPIEE
jgi:hypothetical protein